MAIGDYVLTEDVNADRSLFFFFFFLHLHRLITLARSRTALKLHLFSRNTNKYLFLRSVSKTAAQYSKN